jgi:predicted ATPase/class 3 adenylate cyclase
MASAPLPRGTLTFLFTDIEGSTKLLSELGTGRYHEVLEAHTDALRRAFVRGHEVRIEGDALFVVFATAQEALEAAAAGQRNLAQTTFPHGAVVRVRMGMHTGEGTPASDKAGADYVGIDVHRAARIAAVAHGGQVLASAATRILAGSALPAGVALRDLGDHRLKDLAQPERIFQLVIDGCPSEFPALRTVDRTPNNLPTQLTTFIGREKEIAAALRLLDGTRLLTLTGPGGTGKTRLSLQLAAEAGPQFPDGTFWVPLAPISDPELVPSTIAHSLGVQVSANETPLTRVAEHLRDRQVLIVLDNFEQLLPAAPAVTALLEAAPRLKIVASSRAPLRLNGEQEFAVPPLDLPDPERLPSVEVLAQSDAIRLFIERARAVKPDFLVTSENAAPVAEIVFHLDGLPLAIELAAARVKLLTPQAMLPRLKQGLDLLASTSLDRTDRQRTLRGAIAWSYDLLDEGVQRLFARCACFVGSAQLDQIESVCGPSDQIGRDLIDGVSELVDQSLLRQSEVEGQPRFRMHLTIRDFALECLVASGEEDAIRRRHAEAYIALAERAAPELQAKDQKKWLDEVERDHDNFRAALEYAIGERRVEDATRLLAALWRFWQARSYLREGFSWAERILALDFPSASLRLRALEAAGGLAYWLAIPEQVEPIYREAYELANAQGTTAERALAAYNYSFVYSLMDVPDTTQIRRLLGQALVDFRAIGDRQAIARTAWALGYAFAAEPSREELLEARRLFVEAYDQHAALGNLFDIGWDLHGLGFAALKLGELSEAEARWRDAMKIFTDAQDMSAIVVLLTEFAELAKLRGELERHDVLVGTWAALAERTGVGLARFYNTTEHREQPADIPLERRPALERGLAMTTDDAVAYALESATAKTA